MNAIMEPAGRAASALRSLLLLAFALAWVAASGDVHAAKKDKSMCDGLKGAAKGTCTAAAALGCGEATKHQKQCDVLGDKFEALTGQLPPWEEPVDPPPPPPTGLSATLFYDTDAFDLEERALCEDALGADCNLGGTEFIRQPNDLWLSWDFEHPNEVVFVPVLVCDDVTRTVGVAVLPGTPFANVVAAGDYILAETVLEAQLGTGDTIVMRTCDLRFFKIGVLEVGTDRATIAYEEIPF